MTELGTFRYIDHCASTLAKAAPDKVIPFVKRVALSAATKTVKAIPELLPGTMAVLHRSGASALEDGVTNWFLTSERVLHELAAKIVQAHAATAARSASSADLTLSPRVLQGRSDTEVLQALQRVAGWVIGGHQLAAMLTAPLRMSDTSSTTVAAVSELLTAVALYNYPGSAGDYLRSRLANEPTTLEAKTIEAALAASDAYYEAIRGLPELRELRTPRHRLYLQRMEHGRMQAQIMEQVRETSVMMKLVHRVPLKYGNGSFEDRGGQLSTPSPLHSFSHEVEIPRGEMIDPIGQLLMRLQLRNATAMTVRSPQGST